MKNALTKKQIDKYFPDKSIRINRNAKPWVDSELVKLDRKRKREYNKRKKSDKWLKLNQEFSQRVSMLKESYYEKRVQDLKSSDISQWYSKLRRMSSVDSLKNDEIFVQDLVHLSKEQQAEVIADSFTAISSQYQPITDRDFKVLNTDTTQEIPLFKPYQIHCKIQKMKKKASTVQGDIPWRIIREFSAELAEPLCNVLNSASLEGTWPKCWKHKLVTRSPKVFPHKSTDVLRKFLCSKNFLKVYEALLAGPITEDLKASIDIRTAMFHQMS